MATLLTISGEGANYYGNPQGTAQSLTPDDHWSVESVTIATMFNVAAGADQCLINVYLDEGGDPDTGTLIGTSSTEAIGNSAPGNTPVFTFTPAIILDKDSTYWFICVNDGTTKPVFYRTEASVYSGGHVASKVDGNWTIHSSWDCKSYVVAGEIYILPTMAGRVAQRTNLLRRRR